MPIPSTFAAGRACLPGSSWCCDLVLPSLAEEIGDRFFFFFRMSLARTMHATVVDTWGGEVKTTEPLSTPMNLGLSQQGQGRSRYCTAQQHIDNDLPTCSNYVVRANASALERARRELLCAIIRHVLLLMA